MSEPKFIFGRKKLNSAIRSWFLLYNKALYYTSIVSLNKPRKLCMPQRVISVQSLVFFTELEVKNFFSHFMLQ